MAQLIEQDASDPAETVLYEGSPALFPSVFALLLTIITVGLAAIYFFFRTRSIRYKITNERIVVESGLFSKRMEQLDVYRITDYAVERPFGQRIMGTGNLVLTAMDKSTPQLKIAGLKTDVVALYEQLRKATETEKRRRGVRTVDYE